MARYRAGHRRHATDNADLDAIEDSFADEVPADLDAVSAEWFSTIDIDDGEG